MQPTPVVHHAESELKPSHKVEETTPHKTRALRHSTASPRQVVSDTHIGDMNFDSVVKQAQATRTTREWETLVLFAVNLSTLDVVVNMGNVMGNTRSGSATLRWGLFLFFQLESDVLDLLTYSLSFSYVWLALSVPGSCQACPLLYKL